MPGFDGTGPAGHGPMTGWGRGLCGPGGRGSRPRFGGGRGRGHRFWATGFPGRGWQSDFCAPVSQEDQMVLMQEEAARLERALKDIRCTIEELKAEKTGNSGNTDS